MLHDNLLWILNTKLHIQVSLIIYICNLGKWNNYAKIAWDKNRKVDLKNEPNFYISLIRRFPVKFFFTGPLKTSYTRNIVFGDDAIIGKWTQLHNK